MSIIIKTPILTGIFSHICLKVPANIRVRELLKTPFRRPSAFIGGSKNYLSAFIFFIAMPAFAQLPTPIQPLPSAELAQRLKKLESELRCLVCQNQTLADSPAGLAGDLRREVRSLVESGKTDAEIKDFLQVRYGDFVLYKPPVDRKTWVLWFGPFVLLGFGAAIAVWVGRRRRRLADTQEVVSPTNAAKTERAKALLDDETPK
jgi:cytochrome c-type biogenesis protein CcmH